MFASLNFKRTIMKLYLKKLLENLKEWFIASNRWLHLMAGWGVFIIMAFAIGIWEQEPKTAPVIVGAYLATLFVMLALEVKDKAKSGKFDWKDINAGMLLANICMIIFLFTLLF